jgi:hypothetical protein
MVGIRRRIDCGDSLPHRGQGCPGNRIRLQHSAFCNPSTSCPALCHGCPVRQDRLQSSGRSQPSRVVPGLVPGIHAVRKPPTSKVSCNGAAWMAGTSPAKTPRGSNPLRFSRVTGPFSATGQPWPCAGHPRPEAITNLKSCLQRRRVRTNAPHSPWDGRDKPGHDVEGWCTT